MNAPDEILSSLLIIFYMMLGLCMGSFASAISYRIRNGLSWIYSNNSKANKRDPARSICTSCGHQLSFLDLIPLLSWIISVGKCRYCHAKISATYPLIEIAGAITILAYYFMGLDVYQIIALLILLPFSLSFLLLVGHRFNPPSYIYLTVLLNISILVYSFV